MIPTALAIPTFYMAGIYSKKQAQEQIRLGKITEAQAQLKRVAMNRIVKQVTFLGAAVAGSTDVFINYEIRKLQR